MKKSEVDAFAIEKEKSKVGLRLLEGHRMTVILAHKALSISICFLEGNHKTINSKLMRVCCRFLKLLIRFFCFLYPKLEIHDDWSRPSEGQIFENYKAMFLCGFAFAFAPGMNVLQPNRSIPWSFSLLLADITYAFFFGPIVLGNEGFEQTPLVFWGDFLEQPTPLPGADHHQEGRTLFV